MPCSVGPQAAWVAEANRGERPEFRPVPGPFNAAALIEDALERSHSANESAADELAADDFVEPLGIFCDALETTARLTLLGRWPRSDTSNACSTSGSNWKLTKLPIQHWPTRP